MPIELTGEYTDAGIMVDDESLIENNCVEQIQTLIDHPAFTEPVRIMPDAHVGAGAPVGFTMPLPDRVVPNIVGVDVGCGMAATNLGDRLPLADPVRERRVREAVPMGQNVHSYDDAVHLVDEFPFDRANTVFEQFETAYEARFDQTIDPIEFEFDGYDGEYFKSLCQRVLGRKRQGMGHVIKSAGTLGGGNHFVEFAQARESGEYWLIIHSGSRYLGLSVAEYWQEKATQYRDADAIRDALPEEFHEYLRFDPDSVSDSDLFEWVTGGKGQSHVRKEKIRADFEGERVDEVFQTLSRPRKATEDRNTDLDWLERREADDRITIEEFEQAMDGVYSESVVETVVDEAPMAYKSRKQILETIEPTAEIMDELDVVHNLKARS